MGEKRIPGPVYMVIGAAMILMSVFIDVQKLVVFILAGAVFIVIGFFKILIKLDHDRKEQERHARHAHHPQLHHPAQHQHAQHPAQHQHAQHHAQRHQSQQAQTPPANYEHKTETVQVVRCSKCGVKLHHLFKFCPNCGQRLR
ncbi:hypothetical protein JW898_00585 [Candidatus Woesearchaeota archaeon]|nr:hypothetical protein [Candidatus Woesearchaeota archaeon]